MKYLRKFNESEEVHPYALHMRQIREQVLDTIRDAFQEFEDEGWKWTTGLSSEPGSISIWGFPEFNCRMFPVEDDYVPADLRNSIDMTGEITSDGEIIWNTQEMDFNDETLISERERIKQEFDDFLVAVKRIQSEVGVDFKFSYNNKGGEWRIIIQGAV